MNPNDPNTPADAPTEALPGWTMPSAPQPGGGQPTAAQPAVQPTAVQPTVVQPTTVLPSATPTEVLAPAAAGAGSVHDDEQRRPRDDRGGRAKLRLTKRGRVLLIAGIAVAVVVALVAGLLVANALDGQNAAAELADAQALAERNEEDLEAARADVDGYLAELADLVVEADAGIAITGAGIYDVTLDALVAARDDAEHTTTSLVRPAESTDIPDVVVDPALDARENAEAFRHRAGLLEAAATSERDIATTLKSQVEGVRFAMANHLSTSASVTGAAVLEERQDAADDTKAALQTTIDELTGLEGADLDPSRFAATLAAYRAAVDAVIASSEAARAPTPGGSGVRVPDPASVTAVVNKRRGLPASYVPPDLVIPPGVPNNNNQPVRQVLVPDLLRMQADMAAEGITLRIGSAYRSYADQEAIYNRFVRNEGVAGADTHSARPGNSEHQTGLALDLDDGTGCNLSTCFKDKPGGIWLAANAWKYGFILRYGDGWQHIVGYRFEPWHYRYVGVDVATDMHNRGIKTLEEYYGLPAAPDYG